MFGKYVLVPETIDVFLVLVPESFFFVWIQPLQIQKLLLLVPDIIPDPIKSRQVAQ
jgi:hypothetical protein